MFELRIELRLHRRRGGEAQLIGGVVGGGVEGRGAVETWIVPFAQPEVREHVLVRVRMRGRKKIALFAAEDGLAVGRSLRGDARFDLLLGSVQHRETFHVTVHFDGVFAGVGFQVLRRVGEKGGEGKKKNMIEVR